MKTTNGSRAVTDDEMKEAINSSDLKGLKEKIFTEMGYKPLQKSEQVSMAIFKGYLCHIDDEVWYAKIKGIQKNHRETLMAFENGQTREGYERDPLEVYREDKEKEEERKQKMTEEEIKKEEEDEVKEEEESKTAPSGPGFGFLGSEDDQKALVEQFINSNKGKKEAVEETIEEKVEEKEEDKEDKEEEKVEDKEEKVEDKEDKDEEPKEVDPQIEEPVVVDAEDKDGDGIPEEGENNVVRAAAPQEEKETQE